MHRRSEGGEMLCREVPSWRRISKVRSKMRGCGIVTKSWEMGEEAARK